MAYIIHLHSINMRHYLQPFASLLIGFCVIACSSSPLSKKPSKIEDSKDAERRALELAEIKKTLTEEQYELLNDFVRTQDKLVNQGTHTYAQLLDSAIKKQAWRDSIHKAIEEEYERKKQQQDEEQETLCTGLTIEVLGVRYEESSVWSSDPDKLSVHFSITNNTQKAISAAKGDMEFFDVFKESKGRLPFGFQGYLASGTTTDFTLNYDYSDVYKVLVYLKKAEEEIAPEELKYTSKCEHIIFDDGSEILSDVARWERNKKTTWD